MRLLPRFVHCGFLIFGNMELFKIFWLAGGFVTAFLYGRYLWDKMRFDSDADSMVVAFIYCLIWPIFWIVYLTLNKGKLQ
jgi:hypothetical protein